MILRRLPLAATFAFALAATEAFAQSSAPRFEAGGHTAVAGSEQFDATDVGGGGRFAWRPLALLGLEAELTWYPGDFPDRVAFSRARFEGFFGGTIGPRFGPIRPFATLRPGFLTYSEAPEPIACIAIYPPPLACTLAAGSTVLAVDLGGGVDVDLSGRMFVRVAITDRALRYEGPVFDTDRRVREGAFWSHGLRVATGAGFRF
jgi:hypothetical protein